MRPGFTLTILASAIWPAGPPGAAAIAQSTGPEDLIGARAGQAEGELRRRGYVNTGGARGDDRSYTYWWRADRRQCVSIATVNGRYDSIQPTLPPDCRQTAAVPPTPPRQDRQAPRPRPDHTPDADEGRPPYPGDGPVVDGRNVDLGLVCFGDGSRNGVASGTRWTWSRERDRYEIDRFSESTREVFDASLMMQTWQGGGRIRLPRSLIPPINSRGDNGWWDLSDVSIGSDVIRATYRLNGLNKPRVTVDRRSGRITIQGTAAYGFRGTCDVIGAETRRF